MTGLIWTVQLVHYPAFRYVEAQKFPEFAKFHSRHITPITAIPMLLEVWLGILFLYESVHWISIFNIVLVVLIWLSTFALSVPCHNQLMKQKDARTIERLIGTNWIRTFLWSVKTALLFSAFLGLVSVR